MGRIVVTTDLSEPARRALPLAGRIAQGLGEALLLLHVVHAPALAPALSGSVDMDRRDAERALTELAAGIGGRVRTTVVEAEEVVPAILAETAAADAELLVMASHGRSGFDRLRLGSVVDAVLDDARVPVLCVPARSERPGDGTRVVVASDLSDRAKSSFPIARRLASALRLPLSLLVVESPDARSDPARLDAQARELGGVRPASIELVTAAHPIYGIVGEADLDDAAVLCTSSSPKSLLKRLLIGSVSREVLRAASIPVVVVRG